MFPKEMTAHRLASQTGTPMILQALQGCVTPQVPFWLMRQAGRYLPEYRALRAEAGSFLDLCYNPAHAAEVTLQPVRRFDMDAAIVFSDILVVPHALGQDLRFAEGEGPRLAPVRDVQALQNLGREKFDTLLAPVYETLSRVRGELAADKALIGFAGAPWTVACYMVEGRGGDFSHARRIAAEQPEFFQQLIDIVTDATAAYLLRQIAAGAECLQIFDSWAGLCDDFDRWVVNPTKKIVDVIHAAHPAVPVIGFPRGAGDRHAAYVAQTGVTALGIDQSAQMKTVRASVGADICLQGNLSPETLLAGGVQMRDETLAILDAMRGTPFVFNLGHGIIKETPPEHVAELAAIIKGWRA